MTESKPDAGAARRPFAIAIHGGCGTLAPGLMSESAWADARAALERALRAGWRRLSTGGAAVDAVEAAVVELEDSAHFNAGHGAVLNAQAAHELDASIMDGATGLGAGVAAVRTVRNPVRAARALMVDGRSVLMAGDAADRFAAEAGLEIVPNTYFTTERQLRALADLKARAATGTLASASESDKHGTVGAVACDAHGHLAAATSTGGFNDKPVGRIGDSPVLGAGTFARDGVCAVSGTGQGEFFLRALACHEIACRIRFGGAGLAAAVQATLDETLSPHRIGAGFVAIDAQARITAPYNTLGMYRGWIDADGELVVATHATLHRIGRCG